MTKLFRLLITMLCIVTLAGCGAGTLPPGDRDEIADEPSVATDASAPATLRDLESLEPDGLPCFVSTGTAAGPASGPSGGTVASMVELESGLFVDSDGGRWANCDKLNAAAGFDFIRHDDAGDPCVRYAVADPDAFGVLDGTMYVSLDALGSYCNISGADEPPELGIQAGDSVSEKDRPVLDSVLGAMQDNLKPRGIVIDLSIGRSYICNGMDYIPSGDEPMDIGFMGRVPDGVAYDGRRLWMQDDGLMVETDDGEVVRYMKNDAKAA